MAYTAFPYDPTLPISSELAGNMYLELQAIKQRMNYQVGAGVVVPPALTLTARVVTLEDASTDHETRIATLESDLPALALRVTDLETWQTSHQAAYDAFVQQEADWKTNTYTPEQTVQDNAISANASGISAVNTRVDGVETVLAGRTEVFSGTTAPQPGLGKNGDIYHQFS